MFLGQVMSLLSPAKGEMPGPEGPGHRLNPGSRAGCEASLLSAVVEFPGKAQSRAKHLGTRWGQGAGWGKEQLVQAAPPEPDALVNRPLGCGWVWPCSPGLPPPHVG